MLIDTHCHLDVADFDLDRDQVLARARVAGVNRILIPAIRAAGWPGLIDLCQREAGLFPALGLHPLFLEQHQAKDLVELEKLIATIQPVAVGEIGLDYFLPDLDRVRQQCLFEEQLKLAAHADLPVVLHVRKAHDQVIGCLRRIRVRGGIAHAFSGSIQQAHQYLDLGFKLGFGGMLTFERSSRLRALAKALPLDALVLETDAPDLTVAAHQGERNSPAYLPDVLLALAQVRGQDPEFLATQTSNNALVVFDFTPWREPGRIRRDPNHDK
ncbi:MAG: TatD family hydrolase [Chromatiaceae bacterium]